MGLFSKKTKTTTKRNTTQVATPNNPQWVTDSVQGLNDRIGKTYAGVDPKTFVAGANPLQTMGAESAGNLRNPAGWSLANQLTSAAGTAGPSSVGAESLLTNLDAYKNAFDKDVRQTALADYDFGAGMTRAEDQLAKAGDATFGGSGGAIQTALSNEGLTRGRGALSANLGREMFDTAMRFSSEDANRRQAASSANAGFNENYLQRMLSAGGQLGQLGGMQADNERANIATQMGVGGTMRDITNEQTRGPLELLDREINATATLPLDMFKGMTTTEQMDELVKMKQSGIGLEKILQYAAAAGLALTGNVPAAAAVASA